MINLLFLLTIISNDFLTDASAVIEKEITHLQVGKDFSHKEEKEISIFILTYRGREVFGNLLEKYNKGIEELKILEAKTKKKTGEEIVPEEKAIGDLSTVEKFLAPKYANSRIKSVAFSAVEESARLIYRSEKINKEKKKEFFGSKIFQKEEPVLYSELLLKTPFPIKYQTIGEVKVKEKREGDYFFYQFFCESLPRVKFEPNRVAISEISPRVYWTNLKDWQEVWDLLKKDFYPSVVIKGEIERKAKELAEGKGKIEALREIYNYVTKNWRDIPLTIQDAGLKPTKAYDVYNQKYADNKDKCLLLLSMLKAVGIDAYPGYVAQEIIKDIPSPTYFFYLILVLEMGNRYLFLDPTFPEKVSLSLSFPSILANYNEGFPILPDLIGREVFWVKPDTFFFLSIPYPEPEEITSEFFYTLSLDSLGNLEGEIKATLNGISAIELRANYKDKTEKEKEIALKGIISQIKTGAKLLNWSIENLREPQKPVQISLRFAAERYGIREGKRINFHLPPYLFFPNLSSYFTLPERKYPLDIKIPTSYKYYLQLTIPEGCAIYYSPKDFAFADSLIGLTISSRKDIPTFQLNKEIKFPKRRYLPEEYVSLKNAWSDFAKPENGFIILKKI
ncbi:MAG: DUF3857 domain-containing protein [candidate division WOR-3 bacterium]